MTQPSFWDTPEPPRARRTDPRTSHVAAEKVAPRVSKLEGLVLEALAAAPKGLTSHEIAELTGLSLVTVSPRLAPLKAKGFVRDSGRRRDGRTVWERV